jgi:hypothetical protein
VRYVREILCVRDEKEREGKGKGGREVARRLEVLPFD